MGADHDQVRRFRSDQGTPNERSGQSMIGTTSLNWAISGQRQHDTPQESFGGHIEVDLASKRGPEGAPFRSMDASTTVSY